MKDERSFEERSVEERKYSAVWWEEKCWIKDVFFCLQREVHWWKQEVLCSLKRGEVFTQIKIVEILSTCLQIRRAFPYWKKRINIPSLKGLCHETNCVFFTWVNIHAPRPKYEDRRWLYILQDRNINRSPIYLFKNGEVFSSLKSYWRTDLKTGDKRQKTGKILTLLKWSPVWRQEKYCWQSLGWGRRSWLPNRRTLRHKKTFWNIKLLCSNVAVQLNRGLQRGFVYLDWPISWLTNSTLVYEPKCGGRGGGSCGVSANEYSCTQEPK